VRDLEREGSFLLTPRSADSESPGLTTMFAGCAFGVSSTGVGARFPWKVWPTTTVVSAPFASVRMIGVTGFTWPSPNRFAS